MVRRSAESADKNVIISTTGEATMIAPGLGCQHRPAQLTPITWVGVLALKTAVARHPGVRPARSPDAGGSRVGAWRLPRYLPPGDKHSDVSDLNRGRGLNVSLHA